MNVQDALTKLGYSSFRGNQEEVVSSIMSGKDTFVLMATSGGKSLCYMIPALCLPGYIIVVSPLISLMEDQFDRMIRSGIRAAKIDADTSWDDRNEIISRAAVGRLDALMISPELLSVGRFKELLIDVPPDAIIFDEAHCISSWGQDFRPDYMYVGENVDEIEHHSGKKIVRVALTATASLQTINNIIHYAGMINPNRIISSLFRSNIGIHVKYVSTQDEVDLSIIGDLKYFQGECGIIYCQRRKECDRLQALLSSFGISCIQYHGGMTSTERFEASSAFMNGRCKLIIATIGFGMGIDKSDVRFVIHNGVSASAESWYQEMGRGGRDGKHAASITYVLPGASTTIRLGSIARSNSWDTALCYAHAIYGSSCRMKSVMACFGETIEDCGKCDVCMGTKHDTLDISTANLRKLILHREFLVKSLGKMLPMVYEPYLRSALDQFFVEEMVDYNFVSLEDCPPLVFATATEGTIMKNQEMMSIPVSKTTPYARDSMDSALEFIRSRLAFDMSTLPEEAIQKIVRLRPGADELSQYAGVYLNRNAIAVLSRHIEPRAPRRSARRVEMTLPE